MEGDPMILITAAVAEAVTGYEMAVRRERAAKTRWSETNYWEDLKALALATEATQRARLLMLHEANVAVEEAEAAIDGSPEAEGHLRAVVVQWRYVRQL